MTTFSLDHKIALVTGATGKLSRHICLRLAEAGVDLALQYHVNRQQAIDLKNQVEQLGRRCNIYPADLTDPQSTQQLAESVLADFGHLDLLIHSASVFICKHLSETDDELWQRMFDLHVTALFRLARTLEKNFRSRPGAIVTIADIWGLRPKGAFLAYSVSKAALIALTKALADELAPHTTVNAIAPGILDFPPDTPDALRQTIINRIPMQRPGDPREIADLVVHVASNRYLTGQTIAVDGGRTLI